MAAPDPDPVQTPQPARVVTPASGVRSPKKAGKTELKDLDLATGIDRIPELWNRHGTTVLIVFTVLALGYSLYSYRTNSAKAARVAAQSDVARAQEALSSLRNYPLFQVSDEAYASIRKEAFSEGDSALTNVLSNHSDQKDLIPQALLLRGDLNYAVGLLPDRAAATTRPALSLGEKPEKLFTVARECYQEVVNSFAGRPSDVAHAKLGLAALAENAGDFETAKKLYTEVVTEGGSTPAYRDTASRRLDELPDFARPMRFRTAGGTAGAAVPTTPPPLLPPLLPSLTPAPTTQP